MKRAGVVVVVLLAIATATGSLAVQASERDRAALASIREAIGDERAEEAIESIVALHDAGSASAESHYLLGLAYQVRLDQVSFLSKRSVAARLRATLERALEIDPRHVGAHQELADFFFFAPGIVGGSKQKAAAQIERLAAFSPYDGHRVSGRHAYSSEEYRRAEEEFSAALAIDDSDGHLWFERANSRRQRREKDAQALADYERALELGNDRPVVYYQIGRLCVRLMNCAERGEEALLHFIEQAEGRDQAVGRYRLAQLYEQEGRLAEALDQARTSLAAEPEIDATRALLERVEGKIAQRPAD